MLNGTIIATTATAAMEPAANDPSSRRFVFC
jgi:hypothetical protein